MIHLNQNQGLESQIYEKDFKERIKFGNEAEDGICQYLAANYGESNITYRQKEKEVDFKLPDFVVKTEKGNIEVEVKRTPKIKYRDYVHQLIYQANNNLEVYYLYVKYLDQIKILFRPIKIRDVWNYRLVDKDGVYPDPIIKPYFILDWSLKLAHEKHKKVWFEHHFDQTKRVF